MLKAGSAPAAMNAREADVGEQCRFGRQSSQLRGLLGLFDYRFSRGLGLI